jgi:hypothetical protein
MEKEGNWIRDLLCEKRNPTKWRFQPGPVLIETGRSRRSKVARIYAARAVDGGRGVLMFTRLSQNNTTGPAIYTDE